MTLANKINTTIRLLEELEAEGALNIQHTNGEFCKISDLTHGELFSAHTLEIEIEGGGNKNR